MSTTIDVYPAIAFMPLVEQTRARAQVLFQEFLDQHGVRSKIEVKAFYPSSQDIPIQYVDKDLRWHPKLHLGFGYFIDGKWDSDSWPSCIAVEPDDFVTKEDCEPPFDCDPKLIGSRIISEDQLDYLPHDKVDQVLAQDHYWYEDRNFGGSAIASTGYGFVVAAIAELTDGVIASFDLAFDSKHSGETSTQFLSWWGDDRIEMYGRERFQAARI